MIDGISNISQKNKGFDKRVIDDDPFKDLLTKTNKIYFWDSNTQDRICIQCRRDHSYKLNFEGVRTSIERIPELIPLIFKEDPLKHV